MKTIRKPKKLMAVLGGGLLIVILAAFMGIHTLNFFEYVFPAEQFYYAYLGFGLTVIGLAVYAAKFKWGELSPMQKTVALIMMVVCGLAEVIAAGFGMQIASWQKSGVGLAPEDFDFMVLVTQGFALIHFLAVAAYYFGDDIVEFLGDADGDGTPNYRDPDYQKSKANSTAPNKQPTP